MKTKEEVWRKYYLNHREEILIKNKKRNKTKKRKKYMQDYKKYYRSLHGEELRQKAREYYYKNITIQKEKRKEGKRNLRREILFHYGGNPPKCACCGESHIEFLSIDHINNDGAEHRKKVPGSVLYSWLKRNNFPSGFQILCMNCNCAKSWYGCCPHEKERLS